MSPRGGAPNTLPSTFSQEDVGQSAYEITDLSSNGTWVNGEKIGRHATRVLRHGDKITLLKVCCSAML